MAYDAVIVGGSFAGLAVASALRGRVLVIDRKEIGAGQTSACATYLWVLEGLDLHSALLQIHTSFVAHTADRTIDCPMDRPLCTFDYEAFCRTLAERCGDRGVEFVTAVAFGVRDGAVATDRGEFEGECIIDCTGWRATLAGSLNGDIVDWRRLGLAVEGFADHSGDALHFWFDSEIMRSGLAWVFPRGGRSIVGIGGYAEDAKNQDLKQRLFQFADRLDLRLDAQLHGGYIPHRLRRGRQGNVFLVGDSAGQCLPVTGEGIRMAVYFGRVCAEIVQDVVDGKVSLEEGLGRYDAFVQSFRTGYALLLFYQNALARLPNPFLTRLFLLLRRDFLFSRGVGWYGNLSGPLERRGPFAEPVADRARRT